MKTILHYSTFMTVSVHSCGIIADIDMGCRPLGEINDFVEAIFNDRTIFHGDVVERVFVSDSKTGELIAEFVGDNYNDDDWDYNEDMGYDPYLGCYTDDC